MEAPYQGFIMKHPNKATHFGRAPDGRLIWYYKQTIGAKVLWFYLPDADYRKGSNLFRKCINTPTILLMMIKDW